MLPALNFFAHDWVLPADAPPLVRVATTLPDLWALLSNKPLPMLVVRGLRADGSAAALAVSEGIRAHLRADATFHRHPEFNRRLELLMPELHELWPGLGDPELAAHLLVEMLLDRWLMQRDPTGPAVITRYFDSFHPDVIAEAARLGAGADTAAEPLERLLRAFADSRFLADYLHADGLIRRFARVWVRTAFPGPGALPAAVLVAQVERWSALLSPGSAELLEDVRAAVAAELG